MDAAAFDVNERVSLLRLGAYVAVGMYYDDSVGVVLMTTMSLPVLSSVKLAVLHWNVRGSK